jgi:tRNA(fMet)-specific endonuclease VapC
MTQRILDTDILTLFQKGHAAVCQRCANAPPGALAITALSVEEQFLGWYTRIRQAKSDDDMAAAYQGLTAFAGFIKRLAIHSFTRPAIQRFRQLKSLKLKISKKDLCIAAIVLEQGATLVTRNLRDFRRVPGLKTEDWSQ